MDLRESQAWNSLSGVGSCANASVPAELVEPIDGPGRHDVDGGEHEWALVGSYR